MFKTCAKIKKIIKIFDFSDFAPLYFFPDGVEQKTYIIFRTEFRDLSIYRKLIGIRDDGRELVCACAKNPKMSREWLATLCGLS